MPEFRLAPLLEASRMRLESAEQRLALLRKRLNEAQQKLAQLEHFITEYNQQFLAGQRAGMAAYRQRDFRAFLAKLDLACAQQSEEVARCQTGWDSGFEDWRNQKTRLDALLALRDRHDAAVALADRRQDQKLQDEFAARRGTNLPGNS